MDVESYLASKGYVAKHARGTELQYPCFLDCGEPPDSRKRKLYVDGNTGMYHCKVCDSRGGTTLLQRHFGDDDSGDVKVGASKSSVLRAAADLGHQILTNHDDTLEYLLGRGVDERDIVERRLGVIFKPWSLTSELDFRDEELAEAGLYSSTGRDFFYDHVLIPYIEQGRVVQLRGRSRRDGRYMTPGGERVRAYNLDSLEGAEELILTEGEFDAMVLQRTLTDSQVPRLERMAVVAIPGVNAVPTDLLDRCRNIRRVFIGFDNDEAGVKAQPAMKELFGARTRYLALPDTGDGRKNDWNRWLGEEGGTWEDVLGLVADAGGRRLYSIAQAGREWRERPTSGGIRTGYHQFDEVVRPGFTPGQVVIPLAKTGAGKSLWMINVAYQNRHEPQLMCSLELTREEIYERLVRVYRHHDPRATDREVERGLDNILINDENRLRPGDLELLIEEYEFETGKRPKIVHVDYLGYFARGQRGGAPYERTTEAVMEVKAVAKDQRVVMVTPHQVNRGADEGRPLDIDDARDSGAIEETADFLLGLWRPDDDKERVAQHSIAPSGKLVMRILKSRHGGKGRQFDLLFDPLTLAIVEAGNSAAARKASEDNRMHWRGQSYDDLRAMETVPVQKVLGQ